MYFDIELKSGGKDKAKGLIASIRQMDPGNDPFDKYTYFNSITREYVRLPETIYASIRGANARAKNPTDFLITHLYHMGSEHKYRLSHIIAIYGPRIESGHPQFYLSPARFLNPLSKIWPTEPIIGSIINVLSKIEEQYSDDMKIIHTPWIGEYLRREVSNVRTLHQLFDKFPMEKQPA